jgi:hypothetical protein
MLNEQSQPEQINEQKSLNISSNVLNQNQQQKQAQITEKLENK